MVLVDLHELRRKVQASLSLHHLSVQEESADVGVSSAGQAEHEGNTWK